MRRPILWMLPALLLVPLAALAGEKDAPGLKALTPAIRARLDRVAVEQETETVCQETVNLAGNATAFLISQTILPPREEADLSEAQRARLLAQSSLLATPELLQRVWQRLLPELPAHFRPAEFTYRLFVLDVPRVGAFTPGGGQVFLTRGLTERLLQDPQRGEAALALVLAQQLGHIGLGHTRRGWQMKRIQEELQKNDKLDADQKALARILETAVHISGPLTYFLYTRHQSYEADLFAWELCRNSQIDLDAALDALRFLAVSSDPRLLTDDAYRPDKEVAALVVPYYLSSEPEPSRRLKRLLLERDGIVENETEHGLFRYHSSRDESIRCGNRSFQADEEAIIFLHGLRGDHGTFHEFLAFFRQEKETASRPLLLFRCPNNDSLARNGLFLGRELARVGVAPEKAVFICHSAGGLVFRYYAEKQHGRYGRAFFLGTPHQGSAMTALKFLVDVTLFADALRLGLPTALAQTLPEGRGQVSYDLTPDSLFLRHLGHDPKQAANYTIFYGQCLDPSHALGLRLTFLGIKRLLREQFVNRFESPWLKECGQHLVDELQLPEEVLHGDGVVTVRSAALKGAGTLVKTELDHLALKQDREVMRQILERIRRR